jgi:5'-phosphate synthase pdxT subunit
LPAVSITAPAIGILAVQGDVREHARVLAGLGAQVRTIRRPGELDGIQALVIPGGESTTMDKLVRAFELFDPLRERIAGGLPVYGSCAGMIMLADRIADRRADQQTLGGLDVTVRRNAFGRQVDSFEEDIAFAGLDGPVHAVFIRAPWVEDTGGAVEVLARVEGEEPRSHPAEHDTSEGPAAGRIVAVRQGALLATSFHPEVTGDTRVHEMFVEIVRERS